MPIWRERHPGVESLNVAVMGCVVNGPGEAREADVGLAGGQPNLMYVGGKPDHKVDNANLVDELEKQIRAELARRKNENN